MCDEPLTYDVDYDALYDVPIKTLMAHDNYEPCVPRKRTR